VIDSLFCKVNNAGGFFLVLLIKYPLRPELGEECERVAGQRVDSIPYGDEPHPFHGIEHLAGIQDNFGKVDPPVGLELPGPEDEADPPDNALVEELVGGKFR